MWQAWTLSQAMKVRPSDMYAIEGDFRRFCFDRAVFTFGRALDAELNSVKGKNDNEINRKRERVLAKWLDQPLKFRSPSPTAGANTDVAQSVTVRGDGG